jgi:ABC-type transporter Mla MlaB component
VELTQQTEGVWALSGKIGFANAVDVRDRVQALIGREDALTLEFSGLDENGSVVVALMLHWCRSAAAVGNKVEFAGVPEPLVRLISFVGLKDLLPITQGVGSKNGN